QCFEQGPKCLEGVEPVVVGVRGVVPFRPNLFAPLASRPAHCTPEVEIAVGRGRNPLAHGADERSSEAHGALRWEEAVRKVNHDEQENHDIEHKQRGKNTYASRTEMSKRLWELRADCQGAWDGDQAGLDQRHLPCRYE